MTNPMTDAEMLGKLEYLAASDDEEHKDNTAWTSLAMLCDSRTLLDQVIDSLRVRVEAETNKIVECVNSPLKNHMWLLIKKKKNIEIYECQFCSKSHAFETKDKDHA